MISGTAGVLAEAAFIALTVAGIIGPALGIHYLQQRTGAAERLRVGLARLHPDPRLGALVVAWFFALFLEGAAGFGTPVALAAPFLVAAGMPPVAAVAAALMGHAAGVSFGAIGTPVLTQSALVKFPGADLARATAPYHVILGGVLTAAVVLTIGRAVKGERRLWTWGVLAGISFLVPYALIATFVGPRAAHPRRCPCRRRRLRCPAYPTATAGSGPLRRRLPRAGRAPGAAERSHPVPGPDCTRSCHPPHSTAARGPGRRDSGVGDRHGFSGSVRPLFHPAMLLTVAFAAGAVGQRASGREVREAFLTATRQLGPVMVALIAMVTIARTMSHAGMTDELAFAAAGIGAAWPLASPAVGAFGTFVTGSATASNVLFTELQVSTANAAGLPALPLLGAQGFGAAVGNIVCPHNIVAAVATVGLTGQEGKVLRATFPVAALYVALGGLLALAFTR